MEWQFLIYSVEFDPGGTMNLDFPSLVYAKTPQEVEILKTKLAKLNGFLPVQCNKSE